LAYSGDEKENPSREQQSCGHEEHHLAVKRQAAEPPLPVNVINTVNPIRR
jgi:hypothetical protein